MTDFDVLVFDAGPGNFRSIYNMIHAVGGRARIGHSMDEVERARKVILPGVGHFDAGCRALKKACSTEILIENARLERTTILGICLGMQLLCRQSDEGSEEGLGLVNADVKKIEVPAEIGLKVPHMGWNIVEPSVGSSLLSLESPDRFYFVHSYHVVPDNPEIVSGTVSYGSKICAAYESKNILGVQFHPEKSHRFGKALMKRFLEI